ncbi:hypothetical protein LJC59_00230 [Desulfovibrio sp. OttesenSCG-928-A18]|nr:hypothetical protein [Desulfovibrio sp. OttesenSCG-928-A18]
MYNDCYRGIPGTVLEKNQDKASALAEQRPEWAVYEGDSEKIIAAGVGFHIPINFVDIDPYGDPWPVVDAVFSQAEKMPDKWGLVVNDGLKHFLMLGGAWKVKRLAKFVERYGNKGVVEAYWDICREIIEGKAHACGMGLEWWRTWSGGHGGQMTHYAAVISRPEDLS